MDKNQLPNYRVVSSDGVEQFFYDMDEMDIFFENKEKEKGKELIIKFDNGEKEYDYFVHEYYEHGEIENEIQKLINKGFTLDDYLEENKDRFVLIIGDTKKVFKSIQNLVENIDQMGRKDVDIQRYKGLGEMNPEQLWESTMNPQTRILYKVKIEDGIEADKIFTILMGTEVEARRDFIEKNSLEVKNLDI